jgi:hypothetical protein
MKKYLLAILLCGLLFSGCAAETTATTDKTAAPAETATTTNTVAAPAANEAAPAPAPAPAQSVDLDMTGMGSAIAYSQAVDIMTNPDDYLGKVIKVKGNYYPTYYDPTAQYYHLVLVGDETSCCRQQLEFAWTGDHAFPDDYPDMNAEIIIAGVFERYEELGETYYHLVVDEITETFTLPSLSAPPAGTQ